MKVKVTEILSATFQDLFGAFASLNSTFEEISDVLIPLCELLVPRLNSSRVGPEMCEGTVILQGQHVSSLLLCVAI